MTNMFVWNTYAKACYIVHGIIILNLEIWSHEHVNVIKHFYI